ncbi:MAG: hypothetical protein CR977_00720 [Gammaproteobacteria bacterium]|nr:MAG: hypothetical protein CR977_00720 [Gammaproteobacteria bacterium]
MSNIYEAPQADLTPKKQPGQGENEVTQTMIDNLEVGAKWAKFLAILGYIAAGLTIAGALMGLMSVFAIGIAGIFLVVIYGISGYITYRISYFIHQYSKSVQALIEYGDMGDMIDAQQYFNRYIKWLGIILLIGVVVAAVFFILGLAGVAFIGSQL